MLVENIIWSFKLKTLESLTSYLDFSNIYKAILKNILVVDMAKINTKMCRVTIIGAK